MTTLVVKSEKTKECQLKDSFDPKFISQNMKLSENNTIECGKSDPFNGFNAFTKLTFKTGKHHWKLKVLNLQPNNENEWPLVVGITKLKNIKNLDKSLRGYGIICHNNKTMYSRDPTEALAVGDKIHYGCFNTGDIMDFYVNFESKELVVGMNGKIIGNCVKNKKLATKDDFKFGIASDTKGTKVQLLLYDNQTQTFVEDKSRYTW